MIPVNNSLGSVVNNVVTYITYNMLCIRICLSINCWWPTVVTELKNPSNCVAVKAKGGLRLIAANLTCTCMEAAAEKGNI